MRCNERNLLAIESCGGETQAADRTRLNMAGCSVQKERGASVSPQGRGWHRMASCCHWPSPRWLAAGKHSASSYGLASRTTVSLSQACRRLPSHLRACETLHRWWPAVISDWQLHLSQLWGDAAAPLRPERINQSITPKNTLAILILIAFHPEVTVSGLLKYWLAEVLIWLLKAIDHYL